MTSVTSNGTVFTDSGQSEPWDTPSNAAINDGAYAVARLSIFSSSNSDDLTATGYGFSIPASATIDGIKVSVDRHSNTVDGITDQSIVLVGGSGSNDYASATNWPVTDAVADYGGATDTWGFAWSPAQINANTFGVTMSAILAFLATSADASIDEIAITVYYTEAAVAADHTIFFGINA